MSSAELLSSGIKRTKGIVNLLLADFSDDDMFFRPAKGANHATWQLGHLAKATAGMMLGCDPSQHLAVADDARFGKETVTSDDRGKFPKKAEIVKIFDDTLDAAAAWVAKLSDEDLAKAAPERMRKMAPTVGDIAVLMGGHPLMHVGQFAVMRRLLGKPIVF